MGRQIPELEVRKYFAWAAAASLANLMGATFQVPDEAAILSSSLGFAKHCQALRSITAWTMLQYEG